MWNISEEPPALVPSSRASDAGLLQPLWDHLLLHHRPLISSPFFVVLLAFSSYLLFSLPFAVLDILGDKAPAFHRYKIQRERRPTLGMMANSLSRAVFNHLVFVLPGVLIHSCLMPPPLLPTKAPSVPRVFVDGLGLLLLFDAQYFIWHVAHHKNPHLYRWVHALHHEYAAPFSWASQQLSAPELMAVGFWSSLDPVLLKCHPLSNWIVVVFSIWLSVEDHIGYDLPWSLHRLVPFGLLGGAPAHDMHHQKPNRNFAPFFSHWDRLCGTAILVERTTEKNAV